MGPFFNFLEKRGSFQTLRAQKRWNTQNNPITLYISEISIKFCVDWYIIWGILKIFEIFVFLMLAQNRVSPWGGQMDPKCSKNFSVSYLWYLYTRKKIAIQNSKKVISWNTLMFSVDFPFKNIVPHSCEHSCELGKVKHSKLPYMGH